MGLTPNHLLPYPEDTDEPDVPADIYALANRLDGVLTAVTMQLTERIAQLEAELREARAVVRE
jgi:hypothetical protein